ncbi:MAG: hypothetical protein JNL67_15230 [Planctomycetaceae bacterium]|nr:hypothetical protein [Planctomycetaceae bacterium]
MGTMVQLEGTRLPTHHMQFIKHHVLETTARIAWTIAGMALHQTGNTSQSIRP